MRYLILTIAILSLLCGVAASQTTYYFDDSYTGGSNAGTQAHPYATYATLWTAINSALTASGPVTVYFPAGKTSTNEMDLSQCTNSVCKAPNSTITCTGTGRKMSCSISGADLVTFDGITYQNTGSTTVPAWSLTGVTPGTCIEPLPGATNPPTYTCAQNTASRYTISTSVPITGPTGGSAFSNCVYNFQIQGFSFSGTSGQSANLTYVGNLLFQDNEVTRTALGAGGPGAYIGPGQNGPCHTGAARPGGTDSGPDSVVMQFNIVHDEWGETIYSGASTSDPAGAPGCTSCQQHEGGTLGSNLSCGNGCAANADSCTPLAANASTCSTGAHYRIIGNTIFGSAAWGGQGDGMDIKDGHTDLQIVANQMWSGRYPGSATCTSGGNCTCWNGTNAGTACTTNAACTGGGTCQAGNDGRGMVIESCSLVDSNFVEQPGHDGIDLVASWNTSTGRSQCAVTNNMTVNINSGVGHNNALELEALNIAGIAQWGNVQYQNNSVYNAGNNAGDTGDGILINSGAASGTVLVENNIVHTANTAVVPGPATVDHQDCFNSGGTCTGTGTITTDPQYVSTTAPYVDTNFKLQSGSAANSAGANLFSTFTNDYFATTRPNGAFTIGAFQAATAAVAPTCDHASGTYSGSFSNTCNTVSTGTVILCWSTSTTPVTNGLGTACTTGTSLANNASVTISTTQTFNIVAGTSTLLDSPVTTYNYTINNATPGSIMSPNTIHTANTVEQ